MFIQEFVSSFVALQSRAVSSEWNAQLLTESICGSVNECVTCLSIVLKPEHDI